MTLSYQTGGTVTAGDKVRYHGEMGQVEFVVEGETGDPALDWYFRELGAGVMVREPVAFGRVYVTDLDDGWLEFVSRPGAARDG